MKSTDFKFHIHKFVYFSKITHDQLALLVDIFYLPFDYGEQGLAMLDDFQFMHKNAHILRQNRELDAEIIGEWNTRFENFQSKAAQFENFFRLFLDAPNRVHVVELKLLLISLFRHWFKNCLHMWQRLIPLLLFWALF